ncbi:MAG: MATE family efflux transporter, partial [Thermofilaceae archaeon]
VSAVWMGLAAAALALASPFVGRVFTSDESVAQLVMAYLLLAAASEVGLGVSQALFGAIRGMGSVWLPFAISSFTVVFLRALPAQLLSLRYGAIGAWVTQNTDMYGRALLAYLAWKLLGEKRLARKVV